MSKKLFFLKRAENDVGEIISYIASDNPSVGQRFRTAIQETAELLPDMPLIGSLRVSDKPVLKDVRAIPIKDFGKYFIFYRQTDGGIEIVRVLHTARDYPALF